MLNDKIRVVLVNLARLLSAFILLGATSSGQNRIDVSQCFSEQLVTRVTQDVATNFLYQYLAVINEKTYDKVQANSSATALLPEGLFKGNWDAFQESRRAYFQSHSESLSYHQAMASNSSFLPPEWRESVDRCINQLIQHSGNGLWYFPVFVDPTTIRVELKYRSAGNVMSRVRSWRIDGGNVVDGNGNTMPLYRACYVSWLDLSCPLLDTQSEFILKRTDANKNVRVSLNLTDSSQSTGFDIEVLPKKQRCGLTYAHSTTVSDDRNVEIHTPPSMLLDDFWGGEPNRLQLYYIRLQYPGRILFASCTPHDSYNHVMNNDPNQRDRWQARGMKRNPDWDDTGVFQCLGMTNTGNTRFTQITVQYQVPQTECTEVDW